VSIPFWVAELTEAFWTSAGENEPFPRNLHRAVARALPLSVVLLPRLSVGVALVWLQKCGLVCELPGDDRPLRACLIARRGHGIALVDGSDDDCEQRFSIAHELAHFLRDYWSVRNRLRKSLGLAALEVMDGERPPTIEEQLQSILRDVPLGFHLHLMERDSEGNPASGTIATAEEDADRLAYELLAPAASVLADGLVSHQALSQRLQHVYGLPRNQAVRYARILLPSRYVDPLISRFAVLQSGIGVKHDRDQ
jgi:hypothetical protein